MKLNYNRLPENMAGAAVPDCGIIHKSEIKDTLIKLSDDLEMQFDFNDYIIGSTGKREYSGDIDLVVDDKWWGHGIPIFRKNLEDVFGKENVARNGSMLHLKYPVASFQKKHLAILPRTGFVQVDFMFGDYEWLKFYYFSDENSAYKGAHRNLMISAICSEIDVEIKQVDLGYSFINEHHPDIVRWKWGPNGFCRVHRRWVKDKHGHWKKNSEDSIILGPYFNPDTIIDKLFSGYKNSHALDSVETIMDSVKKNFGMVEQERVWQRSAQNFYDWKDGKYFNYPDEISKYLPLNDK